MHVQLCVSGLIVFSEHCVIVLHMSIKETARLFTDIVLFVLTALLNDVQTARVRTGLETHARHSPS